MLFCWPTTQFPFVAVVTAGSTARGLSVLFCSMHSRGRIIFARNPSAEGETEDEKLACGLFRISEDWELSSHNNTLCCGVSAIYIDVEKCLRELSCLSGDFFPFIGSERVEGKQPIWFIKRFIGEKKGFQAGLFAMIDFSSRGYNLLNLAGRCLYGNEEGSWQPIRMNLKRIRVLMGKCTLFSVTCIDILHDDSLTLSIGNKSRPFKL